MQCRSLSYANSIATVLFFFSSRRRHTRCSRDWSSDVCSSDLDARLNLFTNGFDRALLAQEAVGQSFVLAHQAKQQMLRFNVGTAILAGFVSCKKDDATRFLCIPFEHVSSLLPQGPRPPWPQLRGYAELHVPAPGCGCNAQRARGYASRSATSTCARDAAAPATRTWPKHSARPNLR